MADKKLDRLTELITQLTERVDKGLERMENEFSGVNKKIADIETRVDTKIEGLRASVEKDMKGLRQHIDDEINDKVTTQVVEVKDEVQELKEKLQTTENELRKIQAIVDVPFPPEQSVVIYNLPEYEDESEFDTANWLFKDVLDVTVNIVAALRSKPRDESKLGVVKVQVASTAEKIEILRAKKKVEEHEDTDEVIIRACESHDARAQRLNAKLLLSKFPDGKKYYITGHGLIRLKENYKEEGGSREDDDDVAKDDNGDEIPADDLSDNEGTRGRPKENNGVNTRPPADKNRKKDGNARKQSGGRSLSPRREPKKADDARKKKPRGGAASKPAGTTPRSSDRLKKNNR